MDLSPEELDIHLFLKLWDWVSKGAKEVVLCPCEKVEVACEVDQASGVYITAGYFHFGFESFFHKLVFYVLVL